MDSPGWPQQSTESSTNAGHAYSHIKVRLIRGEFAPGMRLTEQQFASDVGSSRTPVREALRRLVAEGLLEFKPNVGTFVRTWTIKEIGELFDLRVLLESEVAAAAAENIAADEIDHLSALQDRVESNGVDLAIGNLGRISELNREFHRIIAQASNNPRLVSMLANAIEQPIVQQTFRRYSTTGLQRSFFQHRELVDAFRARDRLWAADAMRCHIRAAKHALLGSSR